MKSVLVIGMGRFGRHLAHRLQGLGNDVMIIDKNPDIIERYANVFADAQIGDCTNEQVIASLGVENFDICFVTIGEDFQSSLVITSLLKTYRAPLIIAKAKQDIQADLLVKIGADEVIYPEKDMAERLAIRYNAKNVFDYIPLTEDFSIYEIPILPNWVGESISELNIRRKYKINIVAVKKDGDLHPMPGPDYVFKEGDHIVVIGRAKDVFELSARTK